MEILNRIASAYTFHVPTVAQLLRLLLNFAFPFFSLAAFAQTAAISKDSIVAPVVLQFQKAEPTWDQANKAYMIAKFIPAEAVVVLTFRVSTIWTRLRTRPEDFVSFKVNKQRYQFQNIGTQAMYDQLNYLFTIKVPAADFKILLLNDFKGLTFHFMPNEQVINAVLDSFSKHAVNKEQERLIKYERSKVSKTEIKVKAKHPEIVSLSKLKDWYFGLPSNTKTH